MLKVSPWPSPTERLHSLCSSTSSVKSGSSAGGSSFLLVLLQPVARTARANSAAYFQRITSRIPFGQIVELAVIHCSFRREQTGVLRVVSTGVIVFQLVGQISDLGHIRLTRRVKRGFKQLLV